MIESRKNTFKVILAIIALLMAMASLYFGTKLANNMQARELERVNIWSKTVQKRASLIQLTNRTFDQLRTEERNKIQTYAAAYRYLNYSTDFSLNLEIIQSNKTIPVIITNGVDQYNTSGNLGIEDSIHAFVTKSYPGISEKKRRELEKKILVDSVNRYIRTWPKTHEPIKVFYSSGEFMTVYYTDSRVIRELSFKRDSLINDFNKELISNALSVPVLMLNQDDRSVIRSNLASFFEDTIETLLNKNFLKAADSIEVQLADTDVAVIYYEQSPDVTAMRYFPVVQIVLAALFLFIAYVSFSTIRKSEENRVWAGMAKETAHQLGTPLSSLLAWIQLLEVKGVDKSDLDEMNKDVLRLNTIADRFSKIGSEAKIERLDVVAEVQQALGYLKARVSKNVSFHSEYPTSDVMVNMNSSLFGWVCENVIKNAVDAMAGKGDLSIKISTSTKKVFIDISDTGKGIAQKNYKKVFQPGYSTKKRGWGLGLSLAKRIMSQFPGGKIHVLKSELGKGTTIRIELDLA